jgi:hypothetical protein
MVHCDFKVFFSALAGLARQDLVTYIQFFAPPLPFHFVKGVFSAAEFYLSLAVEEMVKRECPRPTRMSAKWSIRRMTRGWRGRWPGWNR